MKRAEKIALLTKVFQNGNSDAARKQLAQIASETGRALIIFDDLDDPGQQLTPTSPVYFHDRGETHHMTWAEVQPYADRHRVRMLFILPKKQPNK